MLLCLARAKARIRKREREREKKCWNEGEGWWCQAACLSTPPSPPPCAPAKENKMFKFHLRGDLDWAESGIKFLRRRVDVGVARLKQITQYTIRKYWITRRGQQYIMNHNWLAVCTSVRSVFQIRGEGEGMSGFVSLGNLLAIKQSEVCVRVLMR